MRWAPNTSESNMAVGKRLPTFEQRINRKCSENLQNAETEGVHLRRPSFCSAILLRNATAVQAVQRNVFANDFGELVSSLEMVTEGQLISTSWAPERYRFSAFWLRSKCSICSYQLNIWYALYSRASILNWFLNTDEKSGACSALVTGWLGIAVPPRSAH